MAIGDRPQRLGAAVLDREDGPPRSSRAVTPSHHPDPLDRHGASDRFAWRAVWQIPTIVVSLGLIALGVSIARTPDPADQLDGALARAETATAAREHGRAVTTLDHEVEPLLDGAPPAQQARFHLLRADALRLRSEGGPASVATYRIIDEHYAQATALGATLTPAQLERWAEALVETGRLRAARQHLDELEEIRRRAPETAPSGAQLRELERRLIVRTAEGDVDDEALLAMIAAYRDHPGLIEDEIAWTELRRAEILLRRGETTTAIDRLLVTMRRLETADVAPETWGELYLLLGEACGRDGRQDAALFALGQAAAHLPATDVRRGRALVREAELRMTGGALERSAELLDEVVRSGVDPAVSTQARLVRAEVRSRLGDHAGSLEDFTAVCGSVARGDGVGVTLPHVVARIIACHDASRSADALDHAAAYLDVPLTAGSIFADEPDLVARHAETTEARAKRVEVSMIGGTPEAGSPDKRAIGPDTLDRQREAGRLFREAGDAWRRRAELVGQDDVDAWSTATWQAGDCYDRAGLRELAVDCFGDYLDAGAEGDPRRGEVMFRRAQAFEAAGDAEAAAGAYRALITALPRSPYGTRSHVPLARCLVALGHSGEAESVLLGMVDGRTPLLTPEAQDYREALVALGRLHRQAGRLVPAIERLEEVVRRYPDDARLREIRFDLADSHRRQALELREQAVPIRLQAAHEATIRGHLEAALAGYETAAAGDGTSRDAELPRIALVYQADCLFELERYAEAAERYERAALRHRDHASSVHALVQIVNCHDRLGDRVRAEIAHHAALERLRELPNDAFDDPAVVMDRTAWERWLRARPIELAQTGERADPG